MGDVTAGYYFDQDPRYGWVHVMSERKSLDIVIQTPDGAFGYKFKDGEFIPHCVCHAYHAGECCCQTGDWE